MLVVGETIVLPPYLAIPIRWKNPNLIYANPAMDEWIIYYYTCEPFT
jgi:hypothetical protein